MLAFVMVFTGMGIGSWGVDTAWAEEKPFEAIILTLKDGTTYEFIPNFEDYTAVCETEMIPTYIEVSDVKVELKNLKSDEDLPVKLGKNNWSVETQKEKNIKIGTYKFKLSFKQGPSYFSQITYNYNGDEAKAVVKRVEGQTKYEPVGRYNGQAISDAVVEEYAKASKLTVEGGTGKILSIEPAECHH